MIIHLMKDGDTKLNLIKITPDLDKTSVNSLVITNQESQELDDFMNGKLNMVTFLAKDNNGDRTSFILRRF